MLDYFYVQEECAVARLAINFNRVVFVQALNECIMYVSQIYHECITHVTYCKRNHEQYSLKVKRRVLEDDLKYIALSQLVSKVHHECITNVS